MTPWVLAGLGMCHLENRGFFLPLKLKALSTSPWRRGRWCVESAPKKVLIRRNAPPESGIGEHRHLEQQPRVSPFSFYYRPPNVLARRGELSARRLAPGGRWD